MKKWKGASESNIMEAEVIKDEDEQRVTGVTGIEVFGFTVGSKKKSDGIQQESDSQEWKGTSDSNIMEVEALE